jgi:hypothetical protein
MIIGTKKLFASLFASLLIFAGLAAPASAQQSGLVNVDIHNVLNNNTVTVPINAAANICGVDVDVLVLALQAPGEQTFTNCTARADQTVTVRG